MYLLTYDHVKDICIILNIDQDLLLTIQNLFCYLLR